MWSIRVLRLPPRAAAAVGGSVVVAGLVGLGQVVDVHAVPWDTLTFTAAIAVSFTALATLVLVGVPGHPVGRLMMAVGALAGVAVLAASWSGWLPLAWFGQWAWWPPMGLIFVTLLVFPNGRLPSPRWRPFAVVVLAAIVAAAVALAVAALEYPRTLLSTVDPKSERAVLWLRIATAAIAVAMAGLVGALASLAVRWRAADGDTRAQLACLLPGGCLLLLGLVLTGLGLPGAWLVTAVAVPGAMTVAVLRYRLYRLDEVVNRTTVWLVMTLLVIAGFVGTVALLKGAVMGGNASNASLAATGLIAVAFEPLRERVQRGVDHLVYGERDEPYQVISRLGDLLGRTVEPRRLLPLLTGTIAQSLQVPYVAVELDGRDGARRRAEHGRPTTRVHGFDMRAQGERVGRLLVATRSPGGRFTVRERRLLEQLAVQAGVAAQATLLIEDLQESRERLVTAREEERRRLRRDLHDGIGPTLAGMSMQVRAARNLAEPGSRLAGILNDLAADLGTCSVELRALVDQLRPAGLDRGLAAALRAECQRFAGPGLAVELTVDGDLAGLPAATEVAAYRILCEALTNVTRHARARRCRVEVRRDRAVTLMITDDGVGPPETGRRGVGLDSMRERASELGGELSIGTAGAGGTAVRVSLPCPPPPGGPDPAPAPSAAVPA